MPARGGRVIVHEKEVRNATTLRCTGRPGRERRAIRMRAWVGDLYFFETAVAIHTEPR
jgi:hypothetical protein